MYRGATIYTLSREASKKTQPADTLTSGLWPPELRGNKSLLFKLPSLGPALRGSPSRLTQTLGSVLHPSQKKTLCPSQRDSELLPKFSREQETFAFLLQTAANSHTLLLAPRGRPSRVEGEATHPHPQMSGPTPNQTQLPGTSQGANSPSQATKKCCRTRPCRTPSDPALGEPRVLAPCFLPQMATCCGVITGVSGNPDITKEQK